MSEDFQDFDFDVSFNQPVPEWGWREGPWRGRATRKAVSLARGGIPEGMALVDAFQQVFPQITLCAAHIVSSSTGKPEEPIIVDAADLLTG